MEIIDASGKLFGKINIIDACLVLSILLIITTASVYIISTPVVHETQEVLLQLYVQPTLVSYNTLPETQEVFLPGTHIFSVLPYEDAVILNTSIYSFNAFNCPTPTVDVLLTINATLSLNSDGHYLYNGYQISKGNTLPIQVGNSTFIGLIHRFNYTHRVKPVTLTINLYPSLQYPQNQTVILSTQSNSAFTPSGSIIDVYDENRRVFIIANVSADLYNNFSYFDEFALTPSSIIILKTPDGPLQGIIMEVAE